MRVHNTHVDRHIETSATRPELRSAGHIHVECLFNVSVNGTDALMNYYCPVAEFTNKIWTMRREHERPVAPLLKEFVVAFLMEVSIAHHDNLIYQITVELD